MTIFPRQSFLFFCAAVCTNNFFPVASSCTQFISYLQTIYLGFYAFANNFSSFMRSILSPCFYLHNSKSTVSVTIYAELYTLRICNATRENLVGDVKVIIRTLHIPFISL